MSGIYLLLAGVGVVASLTFHSSSPASRRILHAHLATGSPRDSTGCSRKAGRYRRLRFAFDSPSIHLPLAFHLSSTRLPLASLTLVPGGDRFLWDRRLPVMLISPSVLIVASLVISTEGWL